MISNPCGRRIIPTRKTVTGLDLNLPGIQPIRLLKQDGFGAVIAAVDRRGDSEVRVAVRDADRGTRWLRPIARILLRREAAALLRLSAVEGVPHLVETRPGLLVRTWVDGRPLSEGAPPLVFWSSGRALLRRIRACGVTHNDTHKPENWVVRPDGTAGLIDFQLAGRHRRRTPWAVLCGLEDLRHLVKQKRRFARESLTAAERDLLRRRSWPARAWRKLIKPIYRFTTRRLLGYRDREGKGPAGR